MPLSRCRALATTAAGKAPRSSDIMLVAVCRTRPCGKKRFKIMEKEFSQETGEVTPTLKLVRKEITRRYWRELDSLYED